MKSSNWNPLSWRGQSISLRFAPTDPDVLRAVVDRMAEAGLNRLIIETEKGVQYDSHPAVSAEWAMPKRVLREIIGRARDNGITCIPKLPSLSHAAYLIAAYPDIAETQDGSISCPRHPKTYPVVGDLTGELLDLFEPALFHIGHDELLIWGERRPSVLQCPRCRGDDPAPWFRDDVLHWHRYFAERDVGMIMYADMLMTPGDFPGASWNRSGVYGGPPDFFARAIDDLPRDIVMVDWHYEPAREYPTLPYLQYKGFNAIGAPNFHDSSFLFTRYAQRTRTPRLLGMMGTDWTPIDTAHAEQLYRKIADNGAFFAGRDDPELRAKVEAGERRRFETGAFEHVIDFSREGGGLFETAARQGFRGYEPTAAYAAKGLAMKPGRKGKVWIPFQTQPTARFARLELDIEGGFPGPARVGLSVDHGKTYAFRPFARHEDWSDVAAGYSHVLFQIEGSNPGKSMEECLARGIGRGPVEPRG